MSSSGNVSAAQIAEKGSRIVVNIIGRDEKLLTLGTYGAMTVRMAVEGKR